jgi:hypothetical protein
MSRCLTIFIVGMCAGKGALAEVTTIAEAVRTVVDEMGTR